MRENLFPVQYLSGKNNYQIKANSASSILMRMVLEDPVATQKDFCQAAESSLGSANFLKPLALTILTMVTMLK